MHPPQDPHSPSGTPAAPPRPPRGDPALTIPLKKVNAAVRSRTRTSPASWGRWYRRLLCSFATWERENAVFSAPRPTVRPREGMRFPVQLPRSPGSGSRLTFSGLRHGGALGCWKSLTPAQMGMRT